MNNVYLDGLLLDTVEFGSSIVHVDTNIKAFSIFVAKFSNDGNLIWSDCGNYAGYSSTISLGESNSIYYSGGSGNFPFRFAGISLKDSTYYYANSYLFKIDSNGKGLCGTLIYDDNDHDPNPVAADPLGNYVYYSADAHGDLVVFGPDTVFNTIGNVGEYGFLAKWSPCDNNISNVLELSNQTRNVILFPNPNDGVFILQMKNEEGKMNNTIEIYNVLGEKVFTETLRSTQGDNVINLTGQPSGIYLYCVISENGSLVGEGKLIIQK
jgi:DNA-binding beta-propeller fold protein YncE